MPAQGGAGIALSEAAFLTYRAMSNSDDIVLLLEHDIGPDAAPVIVIGANDAFRRASGLGDAAFLGHPVADLFPVPDHADTLLTAIRGAGSLRTELACARVDGGSFMLGLHLMPAPRLTQAKACFVILGRDITAALQARHMQDSIQRLLAKVFSSVDAAVAIVNAQGRIVMTNPGIDAMLGYKPNGLVGRASLDLLAPGWRAAVAANVKRQTQNEADSTYNAAVLRADGVQLPVRITSVVAAAGDSKNFRILTLRPQILAEATIRNESVGKIKLVGLDMVRQALGERWPEVADRAMAAAEAVIKRNCGPQDSYSKVDDSSFLMCFGALSEEEASFRAAIIGREIRTRLIGQGDDPENAYVRAIAARIRFPDLGETGARLQATMLDGLDHEIERIEQAARKTLTDAVAHATYDVEPVQGRTAEQIVATQVLVPRALDRQLVSALAALAPEEASGFDPDGFLIGLAAQHAVASMAQGDTTPILVRIRFDVFASRAASERFLGMCARIDRRLTGRLILLLSSLPDGVPRARLQECINRLRPFCRGVGYQVDTVAELPVVDLANSFHAIIVLPVSACGASTPAKLRTLFGGLQARRAKVLVRGVGSDADAAALRGLGVDMIAMKRPEG